MEDEREKLWHKSWLGLLAPQLYSEEMESTNLNETDLESETEEEYFSCVEDFDMEDDSGEDEMQEKGSITIQAGLHLLCALRQGEDHEETMGPCPSPSTDVEDTVDTPLSQRSPEVTKGSGPSRDTEDTLGHGPSQGVGIDVTYHAPLSQSIVPEVTGPSRESEGTIGDGPSQGTEADVTFGGPVPPCLYPEVIIIPGPRWESEESLQPLLSQREEYEDTAGTLPSPDVDREDNRHGNENQNPDRKKKRWRLKGVRRQIHRLCCCFFCCLLTPTEGAPTPRSEEQAWGHGY